MTSVYRILGLVVLCSLLISAVGCTRKEDAAVTPPAAGAETPDTPAEPVKEDAPDASAEPAQGDAPVAAITEIKTVEIQYCNS